MTHLSWFSATLRGVLLSLLVLVGRPVAGTSLWAEPLDTAAPTGELALTRLPMPLDPAARLRYGEQLLQQAQAVHDQAKQADGHRIAGAAHQALRHFNRATYHFQRALQLHQRLGSTWQASVDQFYLGGALLSQGDTGQARQAYQLALDYFHRSESATAVAHIQMRLGELYAQQRQWEQALASYSRALQVWQQARATAQSAGALHAIGAIYLRQGQYGRALFYLRKALHTAAPTDSLPRSESLASIGELHHRRGNSEAALRSFYQAQQWLPRLAPAGQRGLLYQAIAAAQEAVGDYATAEQTLRESLSVVARSGSKAQLSTVYRRLADSYRRSGKYQPALAAMTRFSGLQDSLFAEERAAQVVELRTRYETEKKEREIELLIKNRQIQAANLHRQKLLRNALAAGALLLLAIVGVLYRGRRQQVRINKLLERKNAAISRQKEELGRLNQTKDTLFSVISHDLRSPLSSLYSLLNLLNMGALPPERLALHSARLTHGLNNTLLLLDNLLHWSAAQMKDDKIRPERLRLDVLAEEAVALLRGDAERKGVLLLNRLPVPTLVRADVNMMRLVLRNLLGNAIKFTPEGGSVTATATAQGAAWVVAVHDTGVGIQAANHDKVFGQLGSFSTLGTAHEKGTGLGLQLCRDFVERNGGQLTFVSQPGQGTTFRFTLPAATPAPDNAPEVALTVAAGAESGTG